MPVSDSVLPAPAAPAQSFEDAMERLEGIVGQMENSKLPLEDLIRCYEEGTRLVKVCSERLAAAEQRIEIITRDAEGEPQAASFPAPPASASSPAKPANRDPKPAPDAPASTGRAAKKTNEVSLF